MDRGDIVACWKAYAVERVELCGLGTAHEGKCQKGETAR